MAPSKKVLPKGATPLTIRKKSKDAIGKGRFAAIAPKKTPSPSPSPPPASPEGKGKGKAKAGEDEEMKEAPALVAGPAGEMKCPKATPAALGKYVDLADRAHFAKWHEKMKSEQAEFTTFLPEWQKIENTGKERYCKIIKETCRFLDYVTDHCLEWRCLPRIHQVREEILNLYHQINNSLRSTRHNMVSLITKRQTEIENRLNKEISDVAQRSIRLGILKVVDPHVTKTKMWHLTQHHKIDGIMQKLRKIVESLEHIHYARRFVEDLDAQKVQYALGSYAMSELPQPSDRCALAGQDAYAHRINLLRQNSLYLLVPQPSDGHVYHFGLSAPVVDKLKTYRNRLVHDIPKYAPIQFYSPSSADDQLLSDIAEELAAMFDDLMEVYPQVVCQAILNLCNGYESIDLEKYLLKSCDYDIVGWERTEDDQAEE